MATKSVKTATTKSKTTAPKVSRARKSDGDAVSMTQPTRDMIASRAYELWCERGFDHGHDVEDWLAAERELNRS
jgi:hypothetical protein